jgi:undecaprenyl-diphosphatase
MEMIIKAIILGIIEGLTEFLPVSSTGHLILANDYLQFEGDFANLFAIVIQSGAILAVLIYFRDKVFPSFKRTEGLRDYVSLWMKVIVGIIPAGFLGVVLGLDELIEHYLFKPVPVALALIFGAFLIIFAENTFKHVRVNNEGDITYKQAFIVGCAQCMALIPGMSRSASTIIGGLFLGFSRSVAAEFSFFLAIPTLLGASLIKLLKAGFDFSSFEWVVLGVGTFVSFIVAYVVIAFFMNYIKKHDFKIFAYYRIILGALVLVSALF